MHEVGRWRIGVCALLVWVVTITGVIGGVVPPAAAEVTPAASGGPALVGSSVAGAVGGQVQSLAMARSGVASLGGFGASSLDQLEEDMIDRLEQKAVGQISRPGFEVWPSSNQLQIIGLPSWFRIEDAAWKTISVEERFADAVAEASAEPARVQYEFSDGVYSCSRQGEAWSTSADSSLSCQRTWDHTSKVFGQAVRARLVYEFDWTLTDALGRFVESGVFTVTGQWSGTLQLTIGEVGTVASDGTSASQPATPRGVDMVSAAYVAPSSSCGWGFLCGIGKAIGSLWNWSQKAWDTLSGGVLTLAKFVWDLGKGCFANIVDAINAVKDVLVKVKDLATDPVGFVQDQFELLKSLIEAVTADPVGFVTELGLEAFEYPLFQTNKTQWAGKIGCQVALSLLTGGGALASKFGSAARFLDKINDFLGSRGKRKFDDGVIPGDRNRDRNDGDGRDKDDEGDPKCLLNSFPTGTPVRMASGSLVPIERVSPGDRVLAADPITGVWSSQLVLDQWSHIDDGRMVTAVLADGSRVTATDHHMFWVVSNGAWLELEDITVGDLLLTPAGVTPIASVIVHPAAETLVWELDTTGPDTFTVNTGSLDLLVHNCSRGEEYELQVQETFKNKIINRNEKIYGDDGSLIGEIDFETNDSIFEVGVSLQGKTNQLHKLVEIAKARGKKLTVVYGPDTTPARLRDLKAAMEIYGDRVIFIPHDFVEP